MSTKVKETTIICPEQETPKGSLWLSSLDLITRSPYTHTHVLFVYEPNKAQNTNSTPFFDTNLIKETLSKALVAFYPMAGRLKTNNKTGRIEIDCNAKGASFIEVETTHVLTDFGDFKPSPELRKVVFPKYGYAGGLSSSPLLMVQLTRFKCGGISLGFVQHHHVADGASHVHFINSWARLTKGLDLDVLPFHDRYNCFAPRDPPQIKFQHLEYEPPLPPLPPKVFSGEATTIIEGLFRFTKEQINTLRLQAMSQEVLNYRPSTFEVIAGHAWRTSCKARGLTDDQDVKLYIPSDGRSRMKDPPLPQGYCGNVIFFTACVAKAGDVMNKPLWYPVRKVHQAVNRVKSDEYLRSAIDYLESQPDLNTLVRGAHTFTSPNFTINSWVTIPYNESDFGWGGPKYVRHGGIKYEGQSYLIASQNGDGSISLAVKLFTVHMALFGKYLYDF
ncbi:anthranilate N-benzoyltransferase protein 2-like [Chenopodium quinoa]|uniref:anthranilate N-benzoyltransferase protein 2-like n=1 Tax=Chenopodium quinoa TaxID=63459 RepID=UPI000B794661|nr:anthranilate N-benzoyltransferase protein 2-like [Chenopodium quinoa]